MALHRIVTHFVVVLSLFYRKAVLFLLLKLTSTTGYKDYEAIALKLSPEFQDYIADNLSQYIEEVF